MRYSHEILGLVVCLAFGSQACRGAPVPFKREQSNDPQDPAAAVATQDDELGVAAPFVAQRGVSYPPGTTRAQVGGRALTLTEGALRASLYWQGIDAGQALLVSEVQTNLRLEGLKADATARPTLVTSLRTLPGECTVNEVQMARAAPDVAFITATYGCTEAPTANLPTQELWAVRIDSAPRVLERFLVRPETSDEPGTLTLVPRAGDQDGDGHTDLLLDVVLDEASTPALTLTWLDRTAGLGREPSEPEQTLQKLAERARQALEKQPAQALPLAEEALRLHRLICREGERPRIGVGGDAGVRCGQSRAAMHAATTRAVALARTGAVESAIQAADAIASPTSGATDQQRAMVRQALAQLGGNAGTAAIEGPRIEPARHPPVHLPLVVFVGTDRLRLREDRPRLVTLGAEPSLAHDRPVAALPEDDLLVRDPTGALAVVDILRACDGYRLRIVPASQIAMGVIATGGSVAQPLIEARTNAPSSLGCDADPKATRPDHGSYLVLGWTAAGIVVARGERALLVKVDARGEALGEPELLSPSQPLPAGLAIGRVSEDGTTYALHTAAGLLVRKHGSKANTRLLHVPGSETGARRTVRDVSLSPDGSTLAAVVDDRVIVLQAEASGS